MINVGEVLLNLWNQSGFAALIAGFAAAVPGLPGTRYPGGHPIRGSARSGH